MVTVERGDRRGSNYGNLWLVGLRRTPPPFNLHSLRPPTNERRFPVLAFGAAHHVART